MYENRTLVRGDNLEEMRENFPDECIDLIATDPPFNSKRDYFIPYQDEHGQEPDVLVRSIRRYLEMGRCSRRNIQRAAR